MKDLIPLSKKYFDIIVLFSREPFVELITKELEYYTDGGNLIGFICLDLIDNNYSAGILSRDKSMQYRAVRSNVDMQTITEARGWKKSFNEIAVIQHDNRSEFFVYGYKQNVLVAGLPSLAGNKCPVSLRPR